MEIITQQMIELFAEFVNSLFAGTYLIAGSFTDLFFRPTIFHLLQFHCF